VSYEVIFSLVSAQGNFEQSNTRNSQNPPCGGATRQGKAAQSPPAAASLAPSSLVIALR